MKSASRLCISNVVSDARPRCHSRGRAVSREQMLSEVGFCSGVRMEPPVYGSRQQRCSVAVRHWMALLLLSPRASLPRRLLSPHLVWEED